MYRTIVRTVEDTGVVESQRGGIILWHRRRQLHPNRRVLRTALRGQRLARRIEHLAHPQTIMELEGGGVEIFQRGELYLGTGCDLVNMGEEFGVNLIVVHPQAHLFRRPRRDRADQKQADQTDFENPTVTPGIRDHQKQSPGECLISLMRIVTQKMLWGQELQGFLLLLFAASRPVLLPDLRASREGVREPSQQHGQWDGSPR